MSNQLTATSLGVNTTPSYPFHAMGNSQLGTLLFSMTNPASTTVRGEINMNDTTRTMSFTNNNIQSFYLDSVGRATFTQPMLNYVSTATNSASVTTNPFVTLPSAGVYFLLVSQCSGTTSQTVELIDNLCKLFVVICSTSSGIPAQLITLLNPNNTYFSINASGQFGISLTVNSGAFTYRAFYQKIF